jgi:osmotically-inducible protein OsmY
MRRSLTWGAGLAAGAIGVLGVLRLTRKLRPATGTDHDSDISARAWSLLCAEFGPKAEDFSVTVRAGVVTLRGDVATLDDIRRLGALAEAIPGVTGVTNLLRLPPARKLLSGEPSEAGVWLS